MRFSDPGVPRTVVFVTSALFALWLIIISIGHTRRSDD
jgi:hypothetical protein